MKKALSPATIVFDIEASWGCSARAGRSPPADAIDRPTSVHRRPGPSNSAGHWGSGSSTHDTPLRDARRLAINDRISGAADRRRSGKGDEHHTSGGKR